MSKTRLKKISEEALKPVSGRAQPKAKSLFAKTPDAPTTPPVLPTDGNAALAVEPEPPKSTPKAVPESVALVTESFFAEISKDCAQGLDDAVFRAKRKSGVRTLSKADVAEVMFRLFTEVANDVDWTGAPKKKGSALDFRSFVETRIRQALQK